VFCCGVRVTHATIIVHTRVQVFHQRNVSKWLRVINQLTVGQSDPCTCVPPCISAAGTTSFRQPCVRESNTQSSIGINSTRKERRRDTPNLNRIRIYWAIRFAAARLTESPTCRNSPDCSRWRYPDHPSPVRLHLNS